MLETKVDETLPGDEWRYRAYPVTSPVLIAYMINTSMSESVLIRCKAN